MFARLVLLAWVGVFVTSCVPQQSDEPSDDEAGAGHADAPESALEAETVAFEGDVELSFSGRDVGLREADGAFEATGPGHKVRITQEGVTQVRAAGPALELRTEAVYREEGARGAPRLVSSGLRGGTAVFEREGHTEFWVNRSEGAEQSWTFPSAPAGSGDLIVRVTAQGLAFSERTPHGLAFGEQDARVLYGHGTWIGADGAHSFVPASFVEGAIELRVPADMLDATSFPATLDPLIGPEIDAADLDVESDELIKSRPDTACLADQCMTVWSDSLNGTRRLRAMRTTLDGAPIDPLAFTLSTDVEEPAIGAIDGQYFIAYIANEGAINQDIYMIRVSPGGNVVSPQPVLLSQVPAVSFKPRMACGPSQCLVAYWEASAGINRVRATRVDTTGMPFDLPGIEVYFNAPGIGLDLAVGWNGTSYLVAFQSSGVRCNRVLTDGSVPIPNSLLVSSATGVRYVGVSTNGDDFLVLAAHGASSPNHQEATRISASRAHLGTLFDFTFALPGSWTFDVAWTGSEYLAVLLSSASEIFGRRYSSSGQVLGADFPIAPAGSYPSQLAIAPVAGQAVVVTQNGSTIESRAVAPPDVSPLRILSRGLAMMDSPVIASNGDAYLAAWRDWRDEGRGIFAAPLDLAGVPTAEPVLLAASDPSDEMAMASNGTDYLVVWHDPVADAVFGLRASGDGEPLDAVPTRLLDITGITSVDATSNGVDYLVTIQAGTNASARIVSGTTGAMGGSVALAGCDTNTRVAWSGSAYVAVCGQRVYRLTPALAFVGATLTIPTPWNERGDIECIPPLCFAISSSQAVSITTGGTITTTAGSVHFSNSTVRAGLAFDGNGLAYAQDSVVSFTPAGVRLADAAFAPAVATTRIASAGTGTSVMIFDRFVPTAPITSYRVFTRLVVTEKGAGAGCQSNAECASLFCSDGVCCNEACGGGAPGDCQACSVATGASADGTCTTLPQATVCRGAAGDCDLPEQCNGVARECPANAFAQNTAVCRPASGDCDAAETCSGSAASCPTDATLPNGATCRASGGGCDPAETCDGSSFVCPGDERTSMGTVCRPSAGDCDVAESCDGVAATCPDDTVLPAATECRPSVGECDVADFCDGSSGACPTDAAAPGGTACGAAPAGECDLQDECNGSVGASAVCLDRIAVGIVCRAEAGPCDLAEQCDGRAKTCATDGVAEAGTSCRQATSECDVAEVCTGVETSCPSDELKPDGADCGDDAQCQDGECVGESMGGGGSGEGGSGEGAASSAGGGSEGGGSEGGGSEGGGAQPSDGGSDETDGSGCACSSVEAPRTGHGFLALGALAFAALRRRRTLPRTRRRSELI